MTPKTRASRQTKQARLKKRMDRALVELVHVDLIKLSANGAGEVGYTFKHALVQDTAQSTLLHGEYKRLNRLVASAYESVYTDRCLDEFATVLAQHYEAGGNDVKSFEYATQAGDQAAGLYANREAIAFYTQALTAAKRMGIVPAKFWHLYPKRGRAYELTDQYELALDNYNEMEMVAREHADQPMELQSITLRANIHGTATPVFDPVRAQELSERGLALALELGDRTSECKVLWNLLVLNRYAQNVSAAIQYGEKALSLARELDLTEQLAFILTDLGGVYMGKGEPARSRELLDEARPIWRALNNAPMLADNLMLAGTSAFISGDFELAILMSGEGAAISRRIGNIMGQAANAGIEADARFERGEIAQALALTTGIVERSEQVNLHFMVALARSTLARSYARIGAVEQAREMAQLATAPSPQPMPDFFRSWIFAAVTEAYLVLDDMPAAVNALEQIQRAAPPMPVSPSGIISRIAEVEFGLKQGNFARAVELGADFAATLRRVGVRHVLAQLLFLQARGLRGLGADAQAAEILQQAQIEAEEIQSRRMLWQIYGALSELEADRGNNATAESLRAQAREIITFIVKQTPPELQAPFLNLPQVRAVMQA